MSDHSFDIEDCARLLGIAPHDVAELLPVERQPSGRLTVPATAVLEYLAKQSEVK